MLVRKSSLIGRIVGMGVTGFVVHNISSDRIRSPKVYSPNSITSIAHAESITSTGLNTDSWEMSEDEKWALKAQQCQMCRMALASPCKSEFKFFDTCLEKLRVKHRGRNGTDEEGMDCISNFHACMFANPQYFKKLSGEGNDDHFDNKQVGELSVL